MFKHHFLLAFRSFLKFKHIFAINLIGLAIGLTTVVLIMLWVKDEVSINRYHSKVDRVYSVLTNHDNANGMATINYTPARMAEAMLSELSQVEKASAISPFIEGVSFDQGQMKISGDGYFVDQSYFEILDVEFLAGNPEKALTGINSVVLSETLAQKLFGSPQLALGKSLKWQVFSFQNEVEVTGVYRDFGRLSTQQPEFLLAFPFFLEMLGDGAHWGNFNASTILLLKEGSQVADINFQIADFILKKDADTNVSVWVQNFGDTYLYGNYENGKAEGGRINYVKLFTAVALFILVIACINFMNLTTARSMSRLKEIGVKKSIGASRKSLVFQFLTESIVLTFLALVLAVLASYLLQPVFNDITGKNIRLIWDSSSLSILGGIWILTSLLAGLYPSFYLSRYKPMDVFKSSVKGSFGELLARKGLVVFQFSISLLLIIGIAVLGKQMAFIQNQNLGYNQAQLMEVTSPAIPPSQLDAFLEQIKSLRGVVNASSLSHPLIGLSSSTIGLKWEGKNPKEQVKFENITVNFGLIETMEFEILEGRAFSPEFGDEKDKIILNKAAAEIIGYADPVGKTVNLWGKDMEIIAVLQDFNFESLKEEVKPAFLKYDPSFAQKMVVRVEAENIAGTIAEISSLYEKFSGQPLDYQFMDEDFQTLYASEDRTAKLANYFGASAILLSCLGLFGLAAFTAEKRKKEIGIRKVMGASTSGILTLISRDFLLLVLVAILIAVPVSWFLASKWLETYALQTSLNWWIFAGSGMLLIFISLLTVGFQALKAASMNPVNSLRSE